MANTLTAIRAIARRKVGLLPTVADASDPFLALWPYVVSEARDQLVTELPIRRVLGESEVSVTIDASGAYDVTAYNFLRLDRVGIRTDSTTIRWCNLDDPFTGWSGTTIGQTGDSVAVVYDGRLLSVYPWDTTTTSYLSLQGVRMPAQLSTGEDYSGLPELCNEAVATGAAIRICQYDPEREDFFVRRLAVLQSDWNRLVSNITGILQRQKLRKGGWRMAPAVGNVTPEGNWTNTASADVNAEGIALDLWPVTLDVTSTVGASSVTTTLAATVPVAVGWTAAGAVRAVSAYTGEILDVATAVGRLSITATLPVTLDGQQVFAGESVRFTYMSRGV